MPFKTMGALASATAALAVLLFTATGVWATPYLLVDATTGETIVEKDATVPWYPASLTKLMTTYVALDAVRQGRLTFDTPLTMSMRAARMAPSKMGFEPGTQVTLDNALKMLMVKSPNDIAVMIAESLSGSMEDFAAEMNATARKLGMNESHFVNPNGLHDPNHYSSARDMAIVARALLTEFPDEAWRFNIAAMQLDDAVIPNHNGMLGHYPGADGMKTGFTCNSGFNIVASATRDGHKLIAVVLGAPSTRDRNIEAAALFERGFSDTTRGPKLADLPASAQKEPKDMRGEVCSRRNAALVAEEQAELLRIMPQLKPAEAPPNPRGGKPAAVAVVAPVYAAAQLMHGEYVKYDPVPVFVGPKPGWTGPVLAAKPAPEAPSEAAAYTTATAPDDKAAESAPAALKGAVKPPAPPAAKKVVAHPLLRRDRLHHPVQAKAASKTKSN